MLYEIFIESSLRTCQKIQLPRGPRWLKPRDKISPGASSKNTFSIEGMFNHRNIVLISWFCLNILGPSNPRNVKVQATSSVSIRVTWDEPAVPNGVIKEYIISYGKSKDYQGHERTVTGNTMERVLDGLDKFTTYFIKVRGKTSKMGNASKILNATTNEDSKYCVTASGKIVLSLQSRMEFWQFLIKFNLFCFALSRLSPAQHLFIQPKISSILRQKTQPYFKRKAYRPHLSVTQTELDDNALQTGGIKNAGFTF